MRLKRWWQSLDSTERRLVIFIIVALLAYLVFWVLYLLGFFPQLDRPER